MGLGLFDEERPPGRRLVPVAAAGELAVHALVDAAVAAAEHRAERKVGRRHGVDQRHGVRQQLGAQRRHACLQPNAGLGAHVTTCYVKAEQKSVIG